MKEKQLLLKKPIVRLEYFDGKKWIPAGAFEREDFAWISLGGDDRNYRTVEAATGKVLNAR